MKNDNINAGSNYFRNVNKFDKKIAEDMEKTKPQVPVFTFGIVAIILGAALLKQFDFQNFKFEKPALSVVYLIVFIFSVYVLVKNFKNK